MQEQLSQYRSAVGQELDSILSWWMKYALDETYGGFVGKIDHHNKIYAEAPKGSVLNARILWAFSAAYNFTRRKEYLLVAERAYQYVLDHFIDKEYGGVFWTVNHEGKPLDTKKQIYALSFVVYGLSEYYRASKNEAAKEAAITLYDDIAEYSYDKTNGGYLEALSREWKETADLRLSAKDANEKKSMNTHLHVLEAFANLYRIWPDEILKARLEELVNIFLYHIISKQTHHLILFFDERWNTKSSIISFGHDIEAAWLLQEAAELLGDGHLLSRVKLASIQLAEVAAEGLDVDGGLWHEYDPVHNYWVRQKHSWPQAEAMIGFLNAWQLTGRQKFLLHSMKSWEFVKEHIIDKRGGEWYWGVEEDYSTLHKEDKAGIWKCPYHNSRACIEMSNRITKVIDSVELAQ